MQRLSDAHETDCDEIHATDCLRPRLVSRMRRRGDSQHRRWSTWGWALLALFSALSFSACIDDVVIPPCLEKGTCQSGGAAGDGDGSTPRAGSGGDLPINGAGQANGGETADAGAAGQAGEAPEPCACTIDPAYLNPACAGKPYQATFTVRQGIPPYAWRLASPADGWSISGSPGDSSSAVLRAEKAPDEAIELTLVVTDARNAQRTLTLPLEVRTTCWFAYLSLEETGPELKVVDPLAEKPTPIPLAHAKGAYDFKFSPDGAFLAYSYDSDEPAGRHLSLLDLTNLHEHAVGFAEDSVTYYSWAPSGSVLAAAFQVGDKTYLGGLRAPSPGATSLPPTLVSTMATIESDLYWVGSDYVTFHAQDGARRRPFFSELASAGFSTPERILRSALVGVKVQTAETGFFLLSPGQTLYNDLSGSVWTGVDHPAVDLVAPSGRYTAALTADGLPQLFPAETGNVGNIVEAEEDAPSCTQLLAWATERERIACVADVPNDNGGVHGEVRIFDLQGDPPRLTATTVGNFCASDLNDTASDSCLNKRDGYSFGSVSAAGVARAFSRSGRHFVFARTLGDSAYVYIADLDMVPVRIAPPTMLRAAGTSTGSLAFAFSPDERFLLVRRGAQVWIIELATGLLGTLRNTLDGEPCTEEFVADPETYCGNGTQPTAPIWAPGSETTAFQSPEGLTIIDLSPFPLKGVKVLPAAACESQCSGQFAFQP